MTINVSPQVEARLFDVAREEGIDPAVLIERLVMQYRPGVQSTADEENRVVIDLLQSWRDEDAVADPEELDRRDAEAAELEKNLRNDRMTLRIPEL
jgi:hypothetical protein